MAEEGSMNRNLIIYAVVAIAIILLAFYITNSLTSGAPQVAVRLQAVNAQQQTYPYQTTQFKIYVNNTGKSPISGMIVGFFLNNVQQNTYTVNLPAGSGVVVNTTYTYQSTGSYDFEAVADPGHLSKISNSSSSQSNLSIVVLNPESPVVYNSIPNNGIVNTQSFYMVRDGIDFALFANSRYDISVFNQLLGPRENILNKTFAIITPYLNDVNGAYALYGNSSIAYVLWIQGSVLPTHLYSIINSFGVTQKNSTINGAAVTSVKFDNRTSLCYLYQGGWTKLLEYQNNSNSSETCTSVLSHSYPSNQSAIFINALKSDQNVTNYQAKFIYTNSTRIATSLIIRNGSLGSFNMFESQFGFFGTYVQRNGAPINVSKTNAPCLGVVYTQDNVNVCSRYLVPNGGGINFSYGMLNSTEITSNYTISLYSLINSSLILGAHGSAGKLIGSLGVNSISAMWTSPYKSSCMFNNMSSTLPCSVLSFNTSTKVAQINITNRFNTDIVANYASCYLPGAMLNQSIGQTIQAGQSLLLNITCNAFTIPGFSYQTSYILFMNYTSTLNQSSRLAVGILNASNLGSV